MRFNQKPSPPRPLKVAWFSFFPVEWMPDFPPEILSLPKMHPATWMKVLYHQFSQWPDIELHVFVLRRQFVQDLIFRHGRNTVYCLRTLPGLRSGSLFWLDTLLLRKHLRRLQPDLVHAWGSEFGAFSIANRLGYPSLLTMQGILGWLGTVFPLSNSLKISRFLEHRALQRPNFITAESSFAMRYLEDHYPHLSLHQVEHAPDPIFSTVRRTPSLKPIRFLAVGTFHHAKGADLILEALGGLDPALDFELVWVGAMDQNFADTLRSRLPQHLWKKLIHIPHLTPVEIAQQHSIATFFLHGARADNSPNSVKEAVVSGIPIIAPHTGGIPDYVHHGKNGLLFQSGDVEDCRAKIRAGLEQEMFARGEVDPSTLATMRNYLSAETMASRFYQAYCTVVAPQTDQGRNNNFLPG